MPPNKAVEPSIRLIEDTNPDAVGAITLIPHPELKAFFRINIPFVNTVVIGNRGPFRGGVVKTDGLPRACFPQTWHISLTPISMGLSGTSGKSVRTLLIRTRGPNRGAIKMP